MDIHYTNNGEPYILVCSENGESTFRVIGYPEYSWQGEPEIRIVRQYGDELDTAPPSIPISMLGDVMIATMELVAELTKDQNLQEIL